MADNSKKSILSGNPLLRGKQSEPEITTPEAPEAVEAEDIDDVDAFTTMTFKTRKTHLQKLRNYAFTNRLELKEALDQILSEFLDKIDDATLLEYPTKPKKTRRRRS